ncbi:MAG: CPBP family intramembrane metalloprotease [Candidatus Omnitrophica bacterium]|nr:CPBP family intramembrane metalloprotease [Candidatus Omnitrophota bacterium]
MNIKKQTWIVLSLFAIISFLIWKQTSYKQISFLNLSIGKKQALQIAQEYIAQKQNVDFANFQHAVILKSRTSADRYLQKTIGFNKELEFIKKNDFNLFYWKVRFFKENEKEEFLVSIDPKNGDIISFRHIISDTAKREEIGSKNSQLLAKNFLKDNFNFDFSRYTFKEESTEKRDNRTDYYFAWQKNGIEIPWSKTPNSGTAKLITSLTISGNEILYFSKNHLDVPDQFSRMIENSKQSGRVFSGIFMLLYYLLLMAAIFFVVIQKNSIAMHATKNFYAILAGVVFVLLIVFHLNNIQNFLFDYSTASTLKIFFSELALYLVIGAFLSAISLVLPGLAGESMACESPKKQKGFLPYLSSRFLSREIFFLVLIGYLGAIIMLGIQSAAFYIGQQYFNVWIERLQIPQLSSNYWPFLTIFIIAIRASLSEEIMFRLFGIHFGTKILKNVLLAVILSSIIWGFGHTHYPIFPMWFRGIEVSILGFFLSFIYLRFGIIPVVVSHYLFDAFWGGAGFILGKSQPFDFITCLFVLFIPLLWGLFAFFINKLENKEIPLKLNQHQEYNLRILKNFLSTPINWDQNSKEQIKQKLLAHGWDALIIDKALELLEKKES